MRIHVKEQNSTVIDTNDYIGRNICNDLLVRRILICGIIISKLISSKVQQSIPNSTQEKGTLTTHHLTPVVAEA